ncbi:MAG TPA: type II secretion system protein GspM [Solirubrobacteraceae bacterium]|jgi:type II secretory pathway pseudopilin PulG
MTTRDRLVLMAFVVLGVLAAGWMLGVSPEREKAAKLDTEVSTAQATLATAQSQLAEAQGAQSQYSTAYASVVKLGKAVPADEEVPSLVYELDHVTHQKDVEFNSITTGTSGSSSSPSATASSTALGAAASGGFTQMPFTFVFRGTFADLYNLLHQVDNFTLHTTSGVLVTGRLLTIQSASLERKQEGSSENEAPSTGSSSTKSSSGKEEDELTGTITATAYVLPPGQGLTGGATSSGPAGTSSTPASSSSSSSSSPTAPALVKVTP